MRVGDASRIFRIVGSATDAAIRDISLTAGYATYDGSFNANGGAVLVEAGNLAMTATLITDCEARDSGGAIAAAGSSRITIVDCTINNNDGGRGGGVITTGYHDTQLTILDSSISGNYAYFGGGISGNDVVIRGSSIFDNGSPFGGGISASTIVLEDSAVSDNFAEQGGGISCQTAVILRSIIDNNSAVPRAVFAAILRRIDRLRGPPMVAA